MSDNMKKLPCIVDTDIAGDIDDTWALAFLACSPEFDCKLALTCLENKDFKYGRAKVTAKQLEMSGYDNIPVGAGLEAVEWEYPLEGWARDYDLDSYKGGFYADGVQALIDIVMESDETVTIFCLGPMTNIAEALRREPRIAEKSKLIAIMGSIYHAHNPFVIEKGSDYNIRANIPAARAILDAPWDITAIPLDVSAHIVIGDDNYMKLLSVRNDNKVVGTVMECFDYWMEVGNCTYYKTHSTSLYDTAAIYYGIMNDYNFIMEDHKLVIDDGGYTNDDENGKLVHCAVYYKYKEMFINFLTRRLCGEV